MRLPSLYTLETIGHRTGVTALVTGTLSALAWVISKHILPQLGYEKVAGVALVHVSKFAFRATIGSLAVLGALVVTTLAILSRIPGCGGGFDD